MSRGRRDRALAWATEARDGEFGARLQLMRIEAALGSEVEVQFEGRFYRFRRAVRRETFGQAFREFWRLVGFR